MNCADRTNFVPRVIVAADSIWYGVNNETKAGPRERLYFLGQANPPAFYFAGSQSFAGNGAGLAVDPWCECYPGYALRLGGIAPSIVSVVGQLSAHLADIVITALGINDIVTNGDSGATVAASYSTYVDIVHSVVPNALIVPLTLLKTLNPAWDTEVQAANALLAATWAGKAYASQIFPIDVYNSVVRQVIGQGYADDVHLLNEGSDNVADHVWTNGFQNVLAHARS